MPDAARESQRGDRVMSVWRALTRPHPSLQDSDVRRKSQLLAGMISVICLAFAMLDSVWLLTRPGYMPPWYGYLIIAGVFASNRFGFYRVAAGLIVAMFPVVAFSFVLSGQATNVGVTLMYLVLAPFLGVVLLPPRGVAVLTASILLGTVSLPVLNPALQLPMLSLLGPMTASLVSGVLGLTYMRQRNHLERERQLELQRSQERNRLAIEATGIGIWDYAIANDELVLSEGLERLLGLGSGAGSGGFGEMLRFVHDDDRDDVAQKFNGAIEADGGFSLTLCVRTVTGETRWVEASGTVMRDDTGTPVRMTGTGLDVTDRRTLENQLRQAQKMEAMGRLAGGIAHDFNNLLTVIVCNAELVAARSKSSETDEILGAATSAGALTQQLLAFTRQADLRLEVVDINQVVSATVGMVERIIGEDVETVFVGAPDLWATRVDSGQIQQVLLNLATNARDAMPDGGRLTISTENVTAHRPKGADGRGDYVRLSVADDGEGMPEETRLRAFDPFFTTKEVGKGSGLGLAVVFGVAVQSRGHVELESAAGRGTIVHLYLPRSFDAIVSVEPAEAEAPGGSETVLVVEDSPAVCRLCRRTLESGGYTVLLATSAQEALELWRTRAAHIDLLLTDVVMPRTGGTELAADLVAARPELPVLFMSGYAPTGDAETANRIASGFLAKPFTRAELLAKVREVLDGRVEPSRGELR